MTYIPDTVMTFKLASGEEIVAKVVGSSHLNAVQITNPVSIAPGPKGMGMIPAIFTADPEQPVELNTSAITMSAPCDEAITAKYIEATTGIAVPSKKIVLG